MEDIRIAVIGHGFMGHEHEKMLSEMEGYRLIGFSDVDPAQLEDVKEGLIRYASNDELIQDPQVQVVLIAANNNQHHDLVCQAARAGKDIICEKPIAMNVEELDDMLEVVDECGVNFTVHHQRRFDPDFRVIKEVYDQKSLGDIYTIKSSLYGFNGNMHDWHVYIKEGGGMLFDWGVHLLDQILWMMPGAKIRSVFADLRNVINFEVDDYFKILMKFDNGVMAEVELGTYYLADKPHDKWFERHWFIGGNKGTAYVDGFEPQGKIIRTSRLLTNVQGTRTMTAAGPTRSFGPPVEGTILTEELPDVRTKHEDYFINYRKAYDGQEDFLVKIPETRRVLALMEAVRESARTGMSIPFEA
ncbi:Inositol 2-dehydrogenase/D-chiro-inositol 3-dehydrogenase [Eubacterium plexicaudatum ASF492]|uniref:Gfo/Idh/MocA-like oxidoreductase N-terminal domain-containing protein n=1 Tax=Eubacterium plexicaudatum ASF492 TaxID=1235802 RepID=N2ANV4_9FIRM|nr:Inositol 2-dehydrogenase/D-chiro-inositol 3-dehydrogenase [Eubacterium plexicaudatum ASF492]